MVSGTNYQCKEFIAKKLTLSVNELSNTIDLESTLVRAEALYRRFQRTVEAIDKKANFPTPKLRQRPANRPTTSAELIQSPPPSPGAIDSEFLPTPPASAHIKVGSADQAQGSSSGIDATATESGPSRNSVSVDKGQNVDKSKPVDKGKRKTSGEIERGSEGLQETPKPKVISQELRELLSRKVTILPRRVVRKEGEGLAKARK